MRINWFSVKFRSGIEVIENLLVLSGCRAKHNSRDDIESHYEMDEAVGPLLPPDGMTEDPVTDEGGSKGDATWRVLIGSSLLQEVQSRQDRHCSAPRVAGEKNLLIICNYFPDL